MVFKLELEEHLVPGYERVVECKEETTGLHAIIAIHSTVLGPAVGGTRFYPYSSFEDALKDVLRLSAGMTYKTAIVEAGYGGGKAVIIGNPATGKSPALFAAYAQFVNSFEGEFITGKDMGITIPDLTQIQRYTHYVIGSAGNSHSGDPCPFTAWGVVRGMQAAAEWLWSNPSLEGRRVAIQGVGGVGAHLAEFLFWQGVHLTVCDVDPSRTEAIKNQFGAEVVSPGEIYAVECDIFSPCAAGGVLNEKTIPQLRCEAVVGAANNQLLNEECADLFSKRTILYLPDFIVNSGGLLNGVAELEATGYDPHRVRRHLDGVYKVLLSVFRLALERGESTEEVAVELAIDRLERGVGARLDPIHFPD